MKSFGQEFYPYESIRALKLADKIKTSDRRALVQHIAGQLPQNSPATRERIAAKLVQRYLRAANSPGAASTSRLELPQRQAFMRLVARQRQTRAQIELLFYQLTQIDTAVGALARELFYPICVAGRAPEGISAAELAIHNGSQLLATAPLLTRAFIGVYVQNRWDFRDAATIDRSLRVLQSAGLIARERMTGVRRHPPAFRLSGHDVALVTFVWALYDEFLPHAEENGLDLALDVLPISDFARTLLLSPDQVVHHCQSAQRHQLLAGQGDQVRLVFGNSDVLVDALLAKAI